MKTTSILLLSAALTILALGCKGDDDKKAKSPAPDDQAKPTAPDDKAKPTTPDDKAKPTPPPPQFDPKLQQIKAGTSCDGLGDLVTKGANGKPFTRKGDTWSRTEMWGCGCPTGPVFTLVYAPKTAPMEIRLCADGSKDTCEMACTRELAWDLSAQLAENQAKDVKLID